MSDSFQKRTLSRRGFLTTAAAGTAAAMSSWPQQVTNAQEKGDPILSKLSDYELTDQYDKPFKLESLKGKPHILIFGYNGCQFCDIIGQNIGRIRDNIKDDPRLQDIPVVVVNIHPQEDKSNARDYVANYYSNDVWQATKDGQTMPDSEAERRALGEKTYDEQAGKPASERVLHLLFPKSAEVAQQMQTDIGGRFNPASADSHSLKISVVDKDGDCAYSRLGTLDEEKDQQSLVSEVTQSLTTLVQGRQR